MACPYNWETLLRRSIYSMRLIRRLREPSLTRDNVQHIVLRKDKVEIGNLAERVLSASGRRMSLDVQEARKRNDRFHQSRRSQIARDSQAD
jgi:hypothetical protein